MKILYLYAELMGYQIPILRQYVLKYKAEVHVVHWDNKKLTPYSPPSLDSVTYHGKSLLDKRQLLQLAFEINPAIVYVSGWMDDDYISVCKRLRKRGVRVVAGSDTPWYGTVRQRVGSIYFKLFIKKAYDFIWVAGPFQYEYARRLGFSNSEILFNCLSADSDVFVSSNRELHTRSDRSFLFVGRFEDIKGIRLLIKAWKSLNHDSGWTLTLIGNGSLKEFLKGVPNVIVKDFLQPEELKYEFENATCFILPSIREPWALVIHEACCMGLPIIASDVCGAAPVFITDGYNGYTFKGNDVVDLVNKMKMIMGLGSSELKQFGANSLLKSQIINPEIAARSFMSALTRNL